MINNLIIEVDITHRCNISCRHCNRLCNAEHLYGITRKSNNMDMRHIYYLIEQIRNHPKGIVKLIRILGGEPLLSDIIVEAVKCFEAIKDDGYIKEINIITNGTIEIPHECLPYIVYAPQIVGSIISQKGRLLSPNEVYSIKNIKHRNITIVPSDINCDYHLCDRVHDCGIHYSVFGFSYTAPCFPSLMITKQNHKYFRHELPETISDLISERFESDVCSICNYALENYKDLVAQNPALQSKNLIGRTWQLLIGINRLNYSEPDTTWIDNIESLTNYGAK